jgi:hypothetical protein
MKIELHVSTPYAHHQNGQVERAMQSILDKARTLLAASGAPRKCWDYAVSLAAYILRRFPNSTNKITPHETLTREKPDISKLVHFFVPGVFHLTKEERHGIWDHKAKLCCFLGFDDLSQGSYRILTVPDGKILVRKDCIFDQGLQQYELHELMDRAEDQELLQFENPDIETQDDGTLVGDNVAPYFALTSGEYIEQADQDELAQPPVNWELTPEESEKQDLIDENYQFSSYLSYHNDYVLPPDPTSVE